MIFAARMDDYYDEIERERVWLRHEVEHDTPAPKACWICRDALADRDASMYQGEDLHGDGGGA